MKEQFSELELQQQVDGIRLGLLNLGSNPEIISIAFYAMPPWKTKGKPDLDVLIVVKEAASEDTLHQLHDVLAGLASESLSIDVWMLAPSQLEQRMKRVAGVKPDMPLIFKSSTEWNSFGFLPVLGKEFLEQTINSCYSSPEAGGPMPPNLAEHMLFVA